MELARGMVAENKLTCALEFPILHESRISLRFIRATLATLARFTIT